MKRGKNMGQYSSKIVAGAALFMLLGLVGAKGVYAEGLSVSADKDACENGDKVTVTVDALRKVAKSSEITADADRELKSTNTVTTDRIISTEVL